MSSRFKRHQPSCVLQLMICHMQTISMLLEPILRTSCRRKHGSRHDALDFPAADGNETASQTPRQGAAGQAESPAIEAAEHAICDVGHCCTCAVIWE